ncbi:MAG: hypothetical protein PHG65_04145 [Kiritimatiellae bacterium]|nr:hypothetical protein [Kiritimatiellia bacterium]
MQESVTQVPGFFQNGGIKGKQGDVVVAPAGEEEGMYQIRERALRRFSETKNGFGSFVIFTKYIQKTASLKDDVLSPGRRLTGLSFAAYRVPLLAEIKKSVDRISDLKPCQ